MRKLIALGIVAAVALAAGDLAAKKAELVTKDGRVLFGEVSETAEGYEFTAPGGGTTRFAKGSVQSVKFFDSVEQAYQFKKSKVAKGDVEGHYKLARWAHENGLLEQMAEQARAVLAINPDHASAKLLMAIYRRDSSQPPPPTTQRDGNGTGTAPPVTPMVGNVPTLTEKDVNVIRVMEMVPGERLRMAFAQGALEKFWEEMAGQKPEYSGDRNKRKFFALGPHRQLEVIMKETNPDLLYRLGSMVTINQDPTPLRGWKTHIQPWILNNCAGGNCHGGTAAKLPWRMINVRTNDEKVTYTNFYIATEYQSKAGRMIDRDKPKESLLLQYAVPPEFAKVHHPQVKGSTIPVRMKNNKDRTHRLIVSWIKERARGGLRFPKLPYHITYPPPKAGAEPAPAPPGPPVRPKAGFQPASP